MVEEIKQVPRGASILIVFFISVIISFVVSFFCYFYFFPILEKKYLYVRVPDIRGMALSEATKNLMSLGLQYNVVEEKESEEVPAGCIISQQPLPKTLVKKNTEVLVTISKGIALIKLPDVTLKNVEDAKKIILQQNLDIAEIKEVESETVEKGLVLNTEPVAGVDVKKGTKITLVISKGKKEVKQQLKNEPKVIKVVVPDIINKSLLDAKKILESKNLKLGNVKKVCDEDKDFDIIISQTPKPNSLVPAGSKVNVVYNTEIEE
ncbi:MAG: PASTA domain-containing protein [Endomicrobia bacterium]|nr:PASTA domain-containing protein [Endomicrobiia bacterium]